jgi:YgiT-type zinc finger domain-containing protein
MATKVSSIRFQVFERVKSRFGNNGKEAKEKVTDMPVPPEQSRSPFGVITIEVASNYDPDARMSCYKCGRVAEQRQINYQTSLNGQTFEIPNVWAGVCSNCGEIYFAPDVGHAIDDKIFERQHPGESQLARLLNSSF